MSRRCDSCGRASKKAASRSHSKIKTLRRQFVNIQKVDGKKICTSCIRTIAKKAKEMA